MWSRWTEGGRRRAWGRGGGGARRVLAYGGAGGGGRGMAAAVGFRLGPWMTMACECEYDNHTFDGGGVMIGP